VWRGGAAAAAHGKLGGARVFGGSAAGAWACRTIALSLARGGAAISTSAVGDGLAVSAAHGKAPVRPGSELRRLIFLSFSPPGHQSSVALNLVAYGCGVP
jgi:hypothetical protein